jgi:hypothetical protein
MNKWKLALGGSLHVDHVTDEEDIQDGRTPWELTTQIEVSISCHLEIDVFGGKMLKRLRRLTLTL